MSGAFQPRVVPFVKASACGNDFILIESKYAPVDLLKFTRRICDRHNGVGADGVEWMFPSPGVDIEARLVNADGSGAEISGNGTRCVAAFLAAERSQQEITIRTGAGVKVCKLVSSDGACFDFETAMGDPKVKAQLKLRIENREVVGTPVSMGNPHYVVFVDHIDEAWQSLGAKIQAQREFPEGVNVEFVTIRDRHSIDVRFFERGAGETQSSGTGSTAAAIAAIDSGRALSPVTVHAAGGAQTVRWEEQVFLRGPARLLCRGEFFTED
jgi:diaminopimelate epimerase